MDVTLHNFGRCSARSLVLHIEFDRGHIDDRCNHLSMFSLLHSSYDLIIEFRFHVVNCQIFWYRLIHWASFAA